LGTEMKSQLQYKVIRVAFDFVNKNPLLEESTKEDIVEESDIKEDTKDGVEEPIESTIEEPTKSVVEEPENVEVEQPTNDEHEEEVGNKTVETIYKDDKIEEEEVEKPAVKSTEETKVVESDNNSSFNPIFIVIVAIIAYFAFQMKK